MHVREVKEANKKTYKSKDDFLLDNDLLFAKLQKT